MRPTILDPLFAPITALSGIGARGEKLYRRLLDRDDGARVVDLLFHLPTGAIDRRTRLKLAEVKPGTVATVEVTVEGIRAPPPHRPKAPFNIDSYDETGTLTITYFSTRAEFIASHFKKGARVCVSGTVTVYDGMLQMVHPDRVVADAAMMPAVEPIYRLTEGLTANMLRKALVGALGMVPQLPEWLDWTVRGHAGWPDFAEALGSLHRPAAPDDTAPAGKAWSRLAFDEFFAFQLELALERAHLRRPGGPPHTTATAQTPRRLLDKLRAALPFRLTASQETAIAAIADDLKRPDRMLRLLQGDVGSGKTVVALFACTMAIEAGGRGAQAAMMAPTEILARQHFATVTSLATAAGLRVAILTGRERGPERDEILAQLAAGEIDLLIGTHALFSEGVVFSNLVLAVIDEQHRFGVEQRLALARKGKAVDLLAMTATPIPRTLVQSYFGEMDVSELRDKPAGRKPITTSALPIERRDEVIAAVGRAISQGRRVYWVCPRVAEDEASELAAAEARAAELATIFDSAVDLVHGRLKSADKDAAMARFAAGTTQLLVCTTVIEVGVDVPAATVMVIEHAEQFGLAQLHQLRGRIGRGTEKSACLLLYQSPLGETARARLAILRETEDGFRIAEEDLRLRGEGELFGLRQSGAGSFRVADIAVHGALVAPARAEAAAVLACNPRLEGQDGEALRTLLYLFERSAAIKLVDAE
jgi:ATP-dependent DNA helicase RecG